MDGYEATRMVFSRIKGLDPVNASKIMGLLLIQDHGDKEMIRLAFGPDTLLRSLILKARKDLGLPSNSPPTPSTPSFPSSFLSTDPISISRPNSRIISSCSRVSSPPSWADLSGGLQSADELSDISNGSSGGVLSGSSSSFPGNGSSDSSMVDGSQLQDQLSCLNDSSPLQLEMLSSPTGWCSPMHHLRSCSVNDMCLGSEDPSAEIGWKPCLFYARGFCKNGSSCRFLHGGIVGFPSTAELMGQCHELLRSKPVQQQQRLASLSQLMGGDSFAFPYSPKSLNLDFQHQQNDPRRVAAALTMGEDIYKHHERSRFERKDFLMSGMASPASRQIYLTFPADSIFKEEDVSNYFSMYGPVQDVRIPYQQQRMFGFVTFVYSETVKLILAKGNPHFVCDARVLVKPYKEKGTIPDKYRKLQQQQQGMERSEFSPCGTPTGYDSRSGPFDGSRSFYKTQDMLWRRGIVGQADLQQALEFHSQKLMNLQLLDVKNHQYHRALYTGPQVPSTQPSNLFNQTFGPTPMSINPGSQEENGCSPLSATQVISDKQPIRPIVTSSSGNIPLYNDKNFVEQSSLAENDDLFESLEQNLPDSPFASPIKASSWCNPAFSDAVTESSQKVPNCNNCMASLSLVPDTSTVDMPSFKSFNCQMARFSSGHGPIGVMHSGSSSQPTPLVCSLAQGQWTE